MPAPVKTRVLFVCIGNACRSPMAEAIARHEASDILEVHSAGLFPMGYLPAMTLETLERNGYPTERLHSKSIPVETLDKFDLILNMSGDPRPSALASATRMEHWPVPDPYGEDQATYQAILEDIQTRIRALCDRLRKPSAAERKKS